MPKYMVTEVEWQLHQYKYIIDAANEDKAEEKFWEGNNKWYDHDVIKGDEPVVAEIRKIE